MQVPPDPYGKTVHQPTPATPQQQPLPSDFMTVLIFAALMLLFAPIFAPIVWWLASRELRRIEVGLAASERITELKIFRIVAIVLTVIMMTGAAMALAIVGISAIAVGVGLAA
jgi:uncharacterized Tic20 family protein